jgi:hypothetical protein
VFVCSIVLYPRNNANVGVLCACAACMSLLLFCGDSWCEVVCLCVIVSVCMLVEI